MKKRLELVRKEFLWWPMLIALAIIILDQATKIWTVNSHEGLPPVVLHTVIDNYFNIVDYRNTGAAWGMFSGNPLPLAMVSLLAFIYFIFDFPALTEGNKVRKFAWAILIGGVFGNFIDRFFYREVIDMIEVFIPMPEFAGKYIQLTANGTYRFPAFNIADSGICVGVFIYFIHVIFFSRKKKKEEDGADTVEKTEEKKQAQ